MLLRRNSLNQAFFHNVASERYILKSGVSACFGARCTLSACEVCSHSPIFSGNVLEKGRRTRRVEKFKKEVLRGALSPASANWNMSVLRLASAGVQGKLCSRVS